jgi:MFS family permease
MEDLHVIHEKTPATQLENLENEDPAHASATTDSTESTESSASKRGPAFFAPLRIANFRRLIAGQTISKLGDQFYFIAIPWLVLRSTSNPIALSLVLGISSITLGIFTLIGGVLADRYGPRALMLGSDSARLIIMCALAAVAIFTTPPLWVIGALSALLGLAGGLFYPASGAMTPHLVPSDDLQAANSFEQLTFQSSNFVGPGIAGVILSATRLTFGFVVDALSFVASVISLAWIKMPAPPRAAPSEDGGSAATGQKQPKGSSPLAALGAAFSFLRQSPFLSMLFVLSFLGNFAVGGVFEIATPLLFMQNYGVVAGPQAFGLAVAGFGLGSIIGAVAAGVASKIHHKSVISLAAILPCAVFISAIPFVSGTIITAAFFAGAGFFLGISNVLIITVIQTLIPLDMMGRMMSLTMLGSLVGSPISIFVYGTAATVVPIPWLFLAGSSLIALVACFALTRKVSWRSA